MKILWWIIGSMVVFLTFLGWRNMLAFKANLFLILLLLLSLVISISFWIFRKKLR